MESIECVNACREELPEHERRYKLLKETTESLSDKFREEFPLLSGDLDFWARYHKSLIDKKTKIIKEYEAEKTC